MVLTEMSNHQNIGIRLLERDVFSQRSCCCCGACLQAVCLQSFISNVISCVHAALRWQWRCHCNVLGQLLKACMQIQHNGHCYVEFCWK